MPVSTTQRTAGSSPRSRTPASSAVFAAASNAFSAAGRSNVRVPTPSVTSTRTPEVVMRRL